MIWFLILDLLQKGRILYLRSFLRAFERWSKEYENEELLSSEEDKNDIIKKEQTQEKSEWEKAFKKILDRLSLLLTVNGINPNKIFSFFDLSTNPEYY